VHIACLRLTRTGSSCLISPCSLDPRGTFWYELWLFPSHGWQCSPVPTEGKLRPRVWNFAVRLRPSMSRSHSEPREPPSEVVFFLFYQSLPSSIPSPPTPALGGGYLDSCWSLAGEVRSCAPGTPFTLRAQCPCQAQHPCTCRPEHHFGHWLLPPGCRLHLGSAPLPRLWSGDVRVGTWGAGLSLVWSSAIAWGGGNTPLRIQIWPCQEGLPPDSFVSHV
jgi:hypothetical protein